MPKQETASSAPALWLGDALRLRRTGISYLRFVYSRFQSLHFEQTKLKIVFKTSWGHLLIQDSSRLSMEISGILSPSSRKMLASMQRQLHWPAHAQRPRLADR